MKTLFSHRFFDLTLLFLLSALLFPLITQGATFENQKIELDPVLFGGSSRARFTLQTLDQCTGAELAAFEKQCDGIGYQLHLGQQFTIISEPLVSPSKLNSQIEARYDNATSILVIPRLVDTSFKKNLLSDPDRKVYAEFILSTLNLAENQELPVFVFTITKLEELNKAPTEVGALEFFNGEEFERLPPGPEGAVLTMRNGMPAWAKRYQIGDVGPHGGTVFYISDNGLHGLEAAPKGSEGAMELEVNQFGDVVNGSGLVWGCDEVQGANSSYVGAGRLNTLQILNECKTVGNYAALFAARFSLNKDEADKFIELLEVKFLTIQDIKWYLPSVDELDLMREQSALLGLVPGRYWSSTERGIVHESGVDLPSEEAFSDQGFQMKTKKYSVRAIHDF